MKQNLETLKTIYFAIFSGDSETPSIPEGESFWVSLSEALLVFEPNPGRAEELIQTVSDLSIAELPEKVVNLYKDYLNELAESYVLGTTSHETDQLMASQDSYFLDRVEFFTNLALASRSQEHKRLKREFVHLQEGKDLRITESAIVSSIRKTERNALKAKMNVWKEEMDQEETEPVIPITRDDSKVISLGWIKYAAAILLLISAFWYFFTPDSSQKTSPVLSEALETEKLIDVKISESALAVLSPPSLGFAEQTPEEITLVEKNHQELLNALEEKIKLESDPDSPTYQSIQTKIADLKSLEKQYIFDGQALTLFSGAEKIEPTILLLREAYYLKEGDQFYLLENSSLPQDLIRVDDTELISELEEIIFDNGG